MGPEYAVTGQWPVLQRNDRFRGRIAKVSLLSADVPALPTVIYITTGSIPPCRGLSRRWPQRRNPVQARHRRGCCSKPSGQFFAHPLESAM